MKNDQPARPSIPICGIGASAGGIEALQQFFDAIPDDLGLAYVVILHLAPDRKSELPTIISRWTKMSVVQVSDHEKAALARNHVYVIGPDRKLEITDTSVGASEFEQPRGQRTIIDLFFRSLAATDADGFAVVLSGTGTDGALGAKAVKESGGLVLVQDPREAAHDNMPRAVIATGVADLILPVRELAARLTELARHKERIIPLIRAAEEPGQTSDEEEKALKSVLDLLRKQKGHDFSKYKRTTVLRRLSRRMQLSHQLTISDYLRHLDGHVAEVQALFDDLLISVTTFFRDPEAWAALQEQVIRPLVEHSEPDEQIRAWVPGCATGEEAYTLAILFQEEFERRKTRPSFIIFASDLDEGSLAMAREGVYPHAINTDVSAARLERYFRADDDHYRVVGDLRDRLVFAAHSLLRDPPFSHLHLISCRNLLIYLDRGLQEQVMVVFRYACRDQAYLFLGASEMANELFQPVDNKHHIFSTGSSGEGMRPTLPEILAVPGTRRVKHEREIHPPSKVTAAELHLAALEEVSPPSILADDHWNVLHLSKSASRFFQQSGGPPARLVTELVRPELRDQLHVLLHRALESPAAQLSPFISVMFNGSPHRVAVLAQRRPHSEAERWQVLITFLDGGEAAGDTLSTNQEPTNELVLELRERLHQSEQQTERIRDDHSLANEDLRAANEELQSLNEEYRSTTEELETSKEELQSINEELQTVNHELKMKLEEVSRANSDLENLMAATDVATLFLDPDLRIKRFTPRLEEIFNVRTRDLDRPIGDLTHTLAYDGLVPDACRVLTDLNPIEREVRSHTGSIFIARLSPYRTAVEHKVDGIVVTFIDVTAVKQAESALRESERKLEAELNMMRHLHSMTMTAAIASNMQDALNQILATAIKLQGADLGNIQLLDRESQQLRIVAQHGFGASFLEHFRSVGMEDPSTCGRALRTRQTSQIVDVMSDTSYVPHRAIAIEAGYRSVQSTPLVTRNNEVVGVLSVHFAGLHAFSERDKQLGDLLGQQAADLIESRARQDRLAQLNEELKKRTADLEASQEELSRQAAELLEQDRNREEFLAALGHELRNPIGAVQNSLAVISAPDDERSRRALVILQRQILHLTRLVNDLLDITRVKHGKLRLLRDSIELNEWALATLETVRQQAESKGLKLEYDLPTERISVDADPDRLAQILDNLLQNAVTYTDAGVVTLTMRREGKQARIAVRDTGIGIDPKDAPALFKPYQQRDQAHRSGGLGLGLTLVKALVEAHGGTIASHSEGRGRGSEFSFTIPLAQTAPRRAPPKPLVLPPARRILVIDDNRDVADMFEALLETLGQQVKVAYDGNTALAMAREHRPQVAFLDLSMPDMSGTDVARQLRQEFAPGELTLVAVTGYDKDHTAAMGAEFDDHLLKPVTPERLVTLLNSLTSENQETYRQSLAEATARSRIAFLCLLLQHLGAVVSSLSPYKAKGSQFGISGWTSTVRHVSSKT